MAEKKVIVIGAGPGGLACAMILAHRGFSVTVYEKEPVVGGRNAPIKLGPYTFDTGPTFLMMKFILEEMFEEAGKKAKKYLKFVEIEPLYHLDYGDIELFPSKEMEKNIEEAEKYFPGSGESVKEFYKKEKRRYELLFPCLQKDYTSFLEFFSWRFIRAIPILGIRQSLYQNLSTYFKDERQKMAFAFQSKYLGMSPWECPAGFTMIPYVERKYGIYHVIGGLNAISAAMAKAAEENGAKIRLSTPVKEIIFSGRKAVGVLLSNGKKDFADEVVINADFGYAATNLFPKGFLKKYSKEKLEKKRLSCSTFMIYLGLDKVYDLPHHNIYFSKDYEGNVEDIFKNMKLPEEPSFYVQNASLVDSTLAPKGHSTIYILVPVPNNRAKINWAKEKTKFRNKIIKLFSKRAKIGDLEKHIKAEMIITPEDWEKKYNVYKGATFNLAHNLSQMLYFRPRNKFEEAENCWLVGGGTHPGSGLPTIYESARITANLISKKHGISYKEPTSLSKKKVSE
ncbi:MAG: phytoene desaturase family protein [Candidatus Diapherotrites archaeon]